MAVNDFSVLLFVPSEPEVSAETKITILYSFLPLILRLDLSHNAISDTIYYDLAVMR